MEGTNVLIQYIIVATVIYIANMLRQKIVINKLNKELKKNRIIGTFKIVPIILLPTLLFYDKIAPKTKIPKVSL